MSKVEVAKEDGASDAAPADFDFEIPKAIKWYVPGGKLDAVYEHKAVQTVLIGMLFFALFGVDSWNAALASNDIDSGLYGLLTFAFIAFWMEIFVCCLCKKDYFK
jgi:hypothetical protein